MVFVLGPTTAAVGQSSYGQGFHASAVCCKSTANDTKVSIVSSIAPSLWVGGALGLGFVNFPCAVGRLLLRKTMQIKSGHSSVATRLRAQSSKDDSNKSDPSNILDSEAAPSLLVRKGPESVNTRSPPRAPYGLITCLASVGFLETSYLTWTKISGGVVTCTIGGNCSDVLNSSYAVVFGVPLAFMGTVAYGAVACLSLSMLSNESLWAEEDWGRWLLLGSTTAMSAASAYFMYILSLKLDGASCPYCVASALLSLSLLLSTLRGFTMKDLRGVANIQLAVGASVLLGLSVAFGDANSAYGRPGDVDLPPVEPEVMKVSTSSEVSLAKHLRSIGAKMYGAFWCSHCFEQKQMFGREAMAYVDYVECYPDGYRKGVPIAKACDEAKIEGFPTWVIKGKTFSGEQDLTDLANASGYESIK